MSSKFFRRRDKFPRRTTYASHKGQYLQVDLVDLSKQDAGYIMNGIDVFSRVAESVKLTSKNQSEIQRGLNHIFTKLGTPENLQSD